MTTRDSAHGWRIFLRRATRPLRRVRRLWPRFAAAAGFGGATVAAAMFFRARFPTEWDSAGLSLGVINFDLSQLSPHPPGYWLTVGAGDAVQSVLGTDPHRSLQVVDALAAGSLVAVGVLLAWSIEGRIGGLLAGTCLATSPFVLFHGAMANSYIFEGLAGVILLWLALKATDGDRTWFTAPLVLGLATGFRQPIILMLGPLAALAVARSARNNVRAWMGALAAGSAAVLLWLAPMAFVQPGGLPEIIGSSLDFYGGAIDDGSRSVSARSVGFTIASTAFLLPALAVVAVGRLRLSLSLLTASSCGSRRSLWRSRRAP